MRVIVRKIAPPYTDVSTESLQAVLRNHAHDKLLVRIGTEQLYDIMGVLEERNEAAGRVCAKTTEEALAEFHQYYLPRKIKRQLCVDYLGEFDHSLVELSDVLPASLYAPQALNKKK